MDLRKIKKLIELVEESGISELEVRSGEEAVRIARPPTQLAADPVPARPFITPADSGAVVTAPMSGTFYAASDPDAAPFVRVGQAVEAGQVVCIIESMKMMNEIVADRSGICRAIDVANGQAVSAGQTLIRLE